MENAAEALKIAFAVMVFVIALTLAFSVIGQARATADTVFSVKDRDKYYAEGLEDITYFDGGSGQINRVVGWDIIIPTIYRYNLESYGVTIIANGTVIGRFDGESDERINKWKDLKDTYNKAKELGYDEKDTTYYKYKEYLNGLGFSLKLDNTDDSSDKGFTDLYQVKKIYDTRTVIEAYVPWTTQEEIIERINADLYGKEILFDGYITYTGKKDLGGISLDQGIFNKYKDNTFTETFKLIKKDTEDGNDTVNSSTKLEIIYTLNN